MRSYTVYVCDTCGYENRDRDLVEKCEARHYGLTVEEMHGYHALKSAVAHAEYLINVVSTASNRAYYENAIKNLEDFKKSHNIKDRD